MKTIRIALAALCVFAASAAHAATDIHFWHAMDGALGAELNALVAKFNASQSEYRVVAEYKGGYLDTLSAARNARTRGNAPDIVQVVDVAMMNVIADKRFAKPLHEIVKETGEKIDPKSFLPLVAIYYSDQKGNLMALPFNMATPVLYYNADAFKFAGLDPSKPLKTWYDVQEALLAIQEAKYKAAQYNSCGLTTAYPSWVMLETLLAWHDEEFATRNNGYEGLNAQLVFNTRLAIRHWSLMTSWVKSQILSYSGRLNEAEARFTSGECAMLTSSSGAYANMRKDAKFPIGVMPMPYYDDYPGAPSHTTTGGASLFAVAGKTPKEYKGVAKFFAFLLRPDVQAEWVQKTSYLPVTRAAYEATKQNGFYDKNPGTEIAVFQVMGKTLPPAHARGVRLGDYMEIRSIIDDEIEQVWAGKKPPKAGLDQAVVRGNDLLRRFERANGK